VVTTPHDEESMKVILAAASTAAGTSFEHYRAATVTRRLALRLAQLGLHDLSSYRLRIEQDRGEARLLAELLLVGTTEAFRDEAVFTALRTQVLPALVERRLAAGARRLRIWSAGTSTGEEAFSLAALGMVAAGSRLAVDVLATDASSVALERAARGLIPRSRIEAPDEVGHFFRPLAGRSDTVEVVPELKERIVFARHDLLDPSRIAPREAVVASFDVVACRNVLIYLRPEAVLQVSARLVKACAPGGVLVLGTAEQVPESLRDQLRPMDGVPSVYLREP
jgi:two-component system, chemotaxis family, CheB/CheR fusion protein